MPRTSALLLLALASCLAPAQERKASVQGDLRIVETFESKLLGNKRSIRILLPESYDSDQRRRYPVLYLHDGQNVFDGMTSFIPNKEWRADETSRSLAAAGLVEPMIIVGIDNAGIARGDEYLPTQRKMGENMVGGRADLFTQFVVEELKPFVDGTFRTKKGAADTGVCGSSFGGIIALHMALTRPDVFGKAMVCSPSLWWDDKVMVKRIAALSKKPKVKFWIDGGTDEGDTDTNLLKLRDAMVAKGWKLGQDLACYVEAGGVHNEDAWAGRFGMALMHLFPVSPRR